MATVSSVLPESTTNSSRGSPLTLARQAGRFASSSRVRTTTASGHTPWLSMASVAPAGTDDHRLPDRPRPAGAAHLHRLEAGRAQAVGQAGGRKEADVPAPDVEVVVEAPGD